MQARSAGSRRWSHYAMVLGLATLGAGIGGQAMAGCSPPMQFLGQPLPGQPLPERRIPESPPNDGPASAHWLKAVYRPGADGFMQAVDDRDREHDRNPFDAAIVGTWRFTFISDGGGYEVANLPPLPPMGTTVDFGTQQWHSDGTEFMISGARPPSTGDVCMGSWEQTGRSTYKLKHIALSWVSADRDAGPSPAAYLGPAIIRESLTLNRRNNAFEGTFTLDQYKDDEVTLLVHLSGTVKGTRFTAD
ncbi:MAG: hypothetical protein JWQ11_2651 [Rhizobacter sp.]|nr:hypothetical protein [Rhizobacter sp.]